jgi:signal transduction histidine kinase
MIEVGATHMNCIVNDYLDWSSYDLKPQLTQF